MNTVFFNDLVKNHKITKNRFWSLIASLVSSIFHKLYGCYSRFASFHSYWIFQILFLFWSNSQLLDCIPVVFHSGLNSRFFLQVFLFSMTDDRIPLVYYNNYQIERNQTKLIKYNYYKNTIHFSHLKPEPLRIPLRIKWLLTDICLVQHITESNLSEQLTVYY